MAKKVIDMEFRKNSIDIVMILPKKEGSYAGEKGSVVRVLLDRITNIDYMEGIFRQMWTALVKNDPQLDPIFRKFFKEQAKMQTKLEKMAQKAEKRLLAEQMKDAEAVAKRVAEEAKTKETPV